MPEQTLSMLGLWLAALLTVFTLSYAFGDNPLFRGAAYLFVGVSAGYAAAVAVEDVLFPYLIDPILALAVGTPVIDPGELAVRGGISVLLFAKLSPRTARLGNPVTALLVGAGAALAIAGALQGTLIPQVGAARSVFDADTFELALQGGYYGEAAGVLLQGFILLLATISTLAYFHFTASERGNQPPRRNILIDALAWVGRIFIAITLATLFSGVLLAALAALVERLGFLFSLLGGGG
jgi:hypothetical protein